MTRYLALTIKGLEDCVCSEAVSRGFKNCKQVIEGIIVLDTDTEYLDPRTLHSISSIAELITVIGVRSLSKRVIRIAIRDLLYILRDNGVTIARVKVRATGVSSRLVERICIREIRRVYGAKPSKGRTLWLIIVDHVIVFGLEIARRVYHEIWATSTGLNPILAFCVVNEFKDLLKHGLVVEVFSGSSIMALEACRIGASYCIGFDINPRAIELSLVNAEKHNLKAMYDGVVGDAHKIPFRDNSFTILFADPPRGRRVHAMVNYYLVLGESLRVISKVMVFVSNRYLVNKITMILNKVFHRRVHKVFVKELIVGGEKVFVLKVFLR